MSTGINVCQSLGLLMYNLIYFPVDICHLSTMKIKCIKSLILTFVLIKRVLLSNFYAISNDENICTLQNYCWPKYLCFLNPFLKTKRTMRPETTVTQRKVPMTITIIVPDAMLVRPFSHSSVKLVKKNVADVSKRRRKEAVC